MGKKKWGESFLKTGVPLEHLTLMTLKSLDWRCELHREYRRPELVGEDRTFEIDLVALQRTTRRPGLCLIIECKYHDEARFWFFLPCATTDHISPYGFVSKVEDPEANSQVLFFAPLDPLTESAGSSVLSLAPKSFWGTVVSHDGEKQENTVHTALKQVAYAMAPITLRFFDAPVPTAILPMIVTSARIFRLQPEIVDLNVIRDADSPSEIAEELGWTWCHQAVDYDLLRHNMLAVKRRFRDSLFSDMSEVDIQLRKLWQFPRWIAVVNIFHLANALEQISQCFDGLEKRDRARECLDITERIMNHDFPER